MQALLFELGMSPYDIAYKVCRPITVPYRIFHLMNFIAYRVFHLCRLKGFFHLMTFFAYRNVSYVAHKFCCSAPF